jgi:hypothetical protein
MHKPFDRLTDRLLRAGVAPHHVRRYVGELNDHLTDLTAASGRDGTSRREAEAVALGRLGSVDTLADAMIARPELRSWAARAPWLAFVAGPLLGLVVVLAAGLVLLVAVVQSHRAGAGEPAILPGWFGALETAVFGLSLYVLPVLAGLAVALVALRQRVSIGWPLLGLIAIAIIGGGTQVNLELPTAPGMHGELSLGTGLLPPYGELANSLTRVAVNLLLTLLPFLLLRGRMTQPNA